MELNLHANATTTPKVRAYIQASKASVATLAAELGVSETTIRRWRNRRTIEDRSHTPKTLAVSLSPIGETLVCELRARLQLPLDDIVEVMRRCLNPKLSRSAIHRCLVRHNLSRRPKRDKPPVGVFEQATIGFIHIDLKYLPALRGARVTPSSPSIGLLATSIWRSIPNAMPTRQPSSSSASSRTSHIRSTLFLPTTEASSLIAALSI